MLTNARVNTSYKIYIFKSVKYNAKLYEYSKCSIFGCVKFECTVRLNANVYQCKCMNTTAYIRMHGNANLY